MSEFVTDKRKITEVVLKEINPAPAKDDINYCTAIWFLNPISDLRLSLSLDGHKAFQQAGIESTAHPMAYSTDNMSWSNTVVLMGKKIPCPYYIEYTKQNMIVWIYDSRISTILAFYPDIQAYLQVD